MDREHPEAAAENHQEPTDLSVPDHVVEDEPQLPQLDALNDQVSALTDGLRQVLEELAHVKAADAAGNDKLEALTHRVDELQSKVASIAEVREGAERQAASMSDLAGKVFRLDSLARDMRLLTWHHDIRLRGRTKMVDLVVDTSPEELDEARDRVRDVLLFDTQVNQLPGAAAGS